MDTDEIIQSLRAVVADSARLNVDADSLGADDDLAAAGMTSHASVNVLLAVEDTFDVEFPDEMLKPSVFKSISTLAVAVRQLQQEQAA